jgi:hypothetical protein
VAEPVDGVEERGGPRPGAVEVEPPSAGRDAAGDVEEAVTDRLGGGSSEPADEAVGAF